MSAVLQSYSVFSDEALAYLDAEEQALEKSEFLNGSIRAMAGGSPRHNTISGNIFAAAHTRFRQRPCRAFNSDQRVKKADSQNFMYPDVTLICGKPQFDERGNLLNPTAIIEVSSPSTAHYDRGEKRAAYFQLESLREYVIVSQEGRYAEQYIRQTDHQWLLQLYHGEDLPLTFPSLDIEIPFSEIYDGADELDLELE